jgi:hypothetical protein
VNGRQSRIAGVVAGLLVVLVVGVLIGERLHPVTPIRPSLHLDTRTLPPGVCMVTPDATVESGSTRMEAKLVTFQDLRSSDPSSYWSATPSPSTYVWVVVGIGEYILEIPPTANHGIVGGTTTDQDEQYYLKGSDCTVMAVHLDRDGWPAWFDKMAAVAEIKFK